MTGPEHYQTAESLLETASRAEDGGDMERYFLAAAQVHATLAVAASNVISTLTSAGQFRAWRKAVKGKMEEVTASE